MYSPLQFYINIIQQKYLEKLNKKIKPDKNQVLFSKKVVSYICTLKDKYNIFLGLRLTACYIQVYSVT